MFFSQIQQAPGPDCRKVGKSLIETTCALHGGTANSVNPDQNYLCRLASLNFTLFESGHFTQVLLYCKKDRKLVFKTNYGLMQVKSIAECSEGSILQYF